MPIDDPLSSLNQQFESEERSTDPVFNRLIQFISAIPLPFQADKILQPLIASLNADRFEKIDLVLEAIRDELRRHEDRIQAIYNQSSEEGLRHRLQEWLALAKDGVERAQRTRAHERIVRIGQILACSLIAIHSPKPDDVEEMMRLAMELSDNDVQMLRELVRIQGPLLDQDGRVPRYQAWQSWEQGRWSTFPGGEIESIFSKLESFGMVNRLAPPNNQNIMADFQNRYALLRRGMDFVNSFQQ